MSPSNFFWAIETVGDNKTFFTLTAKAPDVKIPLEIITIFAYLFVKNALGKQSL
jgi:hypothetical protein